MKQLNREEYDKILEEVRSISIRKSHDYGCGSLLAFMAKGVIVRMNDKMQRLINLVWNQPKTIAVNDEKIEDTALDMINYSIYLVMMLRNKLTEEKKDAEL